MAPERKGSQIARCYRIVAALLAGEQLDRRAIAHSLGIRVAAADTHIKELEAAKIPGVRFLRRGNKKLVAWRGDGPVRAGSRPLAVAACFGAGLAQLFKGTSYAGHLERIRDDVISGLRKRGDFAEVRRKFLFVSQAGEVALSDRHGMLDDLIEAVLRQCLVDIEYVNFEGERSKERVAPWSIAIYGHQLYILAGGDQAAPRPYRISRISSCRVLASTFAYPSHAVYDPEHLFRDSFGIFIRDSPPVEEVSLRFAACWRTYVHTHRWHSTHQVVSDDERGIVVRMRIRVCRELVAFVLGFGPDVEVLAPASLRVEIANRAEALSALYAQRA